MQVYRAYPAVMNSPLLILHTINIKCMYGLRCYTSNDKKLQNKFA